MSRVQWGFSLLEVLVAFAITSLTLGVLFQIFGKGAAALSLGREYTQAIALAESQIASAAVDDSGTSSSGRFADKFDWTVALTDPTLSAELSVSPGLNLRQVQVEVRWLHRDQPRTLQLVTLQPITTP